MIKTLAELKAALEDGSLTLDPHKGESLCLDNDSVTLYKNDECIYRAPFGPESLIEEALTMLGIPWHNA